MGTSPASPSLGADAHSLHDLRALGETMWVDAVFWTIDSREANQTQSILVVRFWNFLETIYFQAEILYNSSKVPVSSFKASCKLPRNSIFAGLRCCAMPKIRAQLHPQSCCFRSTKEGLVSSQRTAQNTRIECATWRRTSNSGVRCAGLFHLKNISLVVWVGKLLLILLRFGTGPQGWLCWSPVLSTFCAWSTYGYLGLQDWISLWI